jgi:hypothetical protein
MTLFIDKIKQTTLLASDNHQFYIDSPILAEAFASDRQQSLQVEKNGFCIENMG